MPLGVMPGGYDEAILDIEPGSTLVLYTDGLVEERGEAIDEGLERLRQAVVDGPDDPEELCDYVLAAMGRSERAADDVAMFVLRTVAVAVPVMKLELSTQPRALTGLRRTLGRWLEAAGASNEESQDIRMAAHEAACNSMEHAYGFEEATFKLDASRVNGEVSITVSDTGGWREPRKTDRGRGLELMRALMDDVELEAGDDGTTVRMRRKIEAGDVSAGRNGKVLERSPGPRPGNHLAMTDLMSPDGLESLRRRRTRDEAVEHYRWAIIVVGALGVGAANYVGLVFAGVPARDSLMIGAAIWVLIVLAYVVLRVVSRRRVVPLPRRGEGPVNEIEPLVRFATRAEAAEEATRRNLQLAEPGEFWKPEPLDGTGKWGLRHRRAARPGDDEYGGPGLGRALDLLN